MTLTRHKDSWTEADIAVLRTMTEERRPTRDISAALGRSEAAIYKMRERLGMVAQPPRCEFCRGPMPPRKALGRVARLCSDKCRSDYDWAYEENARIDARPRTCEHCHAPLDYLHARAVRYCSRACSNRAWWERARTDPVIVQTRRARVLEWRHAVSTGVQRVADPKA